METDAGVHPLEKPLWMGTTLICRDVREGTPTARAPEDTTSPAIFSKRENARITQSSDLVMHNS